VPDRFRSRRGFLRQALAATGGALAFARSAGAELSAPPSQAPRRLIIDSHQHYEDRPDYVTRLVEHYRRRQAMACVLTPMAGFDVIRKAAADHPDIVIPYGQINVDAPEALAEIEKFAAAGFKGIKMHSPRHNWDDPQYFPLYARMQDLQLLALFHTGIAFHVETPQYTSMARMRPAYLDTIARAFPNLYIQGAHLGNPWYDEAAEAARWCARLYFDVTGSSLIKKEKNLAVFKDYLWWSGPGAHSSPQAVYAFEKLVFGTDEPPEQIDNMLRRYEALLDACDVPEPSRRKIFGETIARLVRLKINI
jgi:predicted TIM-barrel fold metal-dependent hydrolase